MPRQRAPCLTLLAALALAVARSADAQSVPIPTPKNVILPNYDNVFIGPVEALEAGAYLARTADATATFYNPAGLAAADKSALSASASGFVWTQLNSRALGQSSSASQIASTPGHFAVLIGAPFIKTDAIRLGLAVTNIVSWSPGGVDQASTTAPNTIPALTYSSQVSLSTSVTAASLGYRSSPTLRFGVSAGLASTSYADRETLSGDTLAPEPPGHFLSTLRASGSIKHLVMSFGAQWDATPDLTVGALARAPGLALTSSSLVTYESAVERPGAATSAYFRDGDGVFQINLPLELSGGLAYRIGPVRAEIDARYHDTAGQYAMYHSATPLIVHAENLDGTTTTTNESFPDIRYTSQPVLNVAAGASWQVGGRLTFHGGFFASFSPIGDAAGSPFEKADLYGATLGAAVTGEHWSYSLGLAYQFGSSGSVPAGTAASVTDLDWRSLTLLYALAFRF